jgi:hypothetical protein
VEVEYEHQVPALSHNHLVHAALPADLQLGT